MTDAGRTRAGCGSRRRFLKAASAGVAATVIARGAPFALGARKPAKKPNIVICIADDMGWRDAGCYGSPDVKTPNFDRVAAEGMRFDRAFTATAMCAPTRQQLYTGVFPVRNGAYPNHSNVREGARSMVHHFRALGYRVALAGKTHFGPAASFPFEKIKPAEVGEFIARDKAQPFCLVYASNSPHLPWSAGDAGAYKPDRLTLAPDRIDTSAMRKELCKYFAEITDFDREVGVVDAAVTKAGAKANTIFIVTTEQGPPLLHGKWTCYDDGLGVGLALRWPGRVKAGSTTTAMVQYVDVVPTLIEAAGGDPTKVDTGLPGAADGGRGFDGRSFLAVLEGKADSHNEYVFGAHTTRGIINGSECYPIRSIRSRTHKYIRNLNHKAPFRNIVQRNTDPKGYWGSWLEKARTDPEAARLVGLYTNRPAEELYDVAKDPHEQHNLADDPALAAVKADLSKRLDAWMAQQGDKGKQTEMLAHGRKRKPKPKRKGKT